MNGEYQNEQQNMGTQGQNAPQGAYTAPNVDLHAGYTPPVRTSSGEGKPGSGLLKVIVILLAVLVVIEAASLVTTFARGGAQVRSGEMPSFMQEGSSPFEQNTTEPDGQTESTN